MRLGIDIDNVVTDFDKEILKEFLLEDKHKRNKGIINPNAQHINYGMFDWSKEEVDEFYTKNMERIAKNLSPRRNCKKIIDKLLDDGHEIYLISHRATPHYKQPEKTTIDWLNKHNIKCTKLILSKTPDKTLECKKYKIDIMLDDRIDKCKVMNEQNITCFVMQTRYHRQEKHNLKIITSWNNFYKEINLWQKKK